MAIDTLKSSSESSLSAGLDACRDIIAPALDAEVCTINGWRLPLKERRISV